MACGYVLLSCVASGSRRLVVLKNNKGVEENRVRHLDYGVQFNKLMYQRMLKNEKITLFSPSDVPGLYEAFLRIVEFERLYIQYENDPTIRKKQIDALELFTPLRRACEHGSNLSTKCRLLQYTQSV